MKKLALVMAHYAWWIDHQLRHHEGGSFRERS